jgi:hypothetical protein
MVDPAAGTRFTGQSAQIQLKSTATLSSLTPGKAVSVFVEDVAAGGSVVLRLHGRRLLAATQFPLRKGEWYVVRALRVDGRLSLKLESQVSRAVMAAEVAKSAGLPENAISEAVVRAFLRTGLPLIPERLLRVYRRVLAESRRTGRDAREFARLEALAERKGLVFGDDPWEIFGSGRGSSGSGGRGGHDAHGQGESCGSQDGKRGAPDESQVRECFRLSAEADHPIQLFNHIVGEGDHWIVVPISAPGTNLDASLRMRIPRAYALGADRRQPAVREATLVVTQGDSRWLFGLQPTKTGLRVVLLSQPEGAAEPAGLSGLVDRLGQWGITFATDALDARWDDGFSQTDGADIMTSVDSSA